MNGIEYISIIGASLTYCKTSTGYELEEIYSKIPGQGKKITQKFVRQIGPGQTVRGVIIEENSLKRLNELGLIDQVDTSEQDLEVTDPNILKQIKICRVLSGGGIHISHLLLKFMANLTEDDFETAFQDRKKVEVQFHGHT